MDNDSLCSNDTNMWRKVTQGAVNKPVACVNAECNIWTCVDPSGRAV
jgi:hypothetical protein